VTESVSSFFLNYFILACSLNWGLKMQKKYCQRQAHFEISAPPIGYQEFVLAHRF